MEYVGQGMGMAVGLAMGLGPSSPSIPSIRVSNGFVFYLVGQLEMR